MALLSFQDCEEFGDVMQRSRAVDLLKEVRRRENDWKPYKVAAVEFSARKIWH